MRTTRQPNINLVYAVGISTLLAIFALSISTLYLVGFYLYTTYLEPKVEAPINQSRRDLEDKHRELLLKSGFRSDVNLKAASDEELKAANRKLEIAIRAGK